MVKDMTRKQRIETTLMHHLSPALLNVTNESYQHHVSEGAETHFKILIITEQFQTLSRIDRQRRINTLLAEEFKQRFACLELALAHPSRMGFIAKIKPLTPLLVEMAFTMNNTILKMFYRRVIYHGLNLSSFFIG